MSSMDDRIGVSIELDDHSVVAGLERVNHSIATFSHEAGSKVKEVAGELLGLVTAGLSVEKMFEAVKEGFKQADFLRDLRASTEAVSSSGVAGVEAWNNLEKAAEKTRSTGNELVQIYGKLLPTAMDRGFSEQQLQKWVVQITKLAPAIGQSVEQTVDQFTQILAGKVRKTNLLAHAIGLDSEAYTAGKQQLESTAARVDELAAKGEHMGQTFASSFEKIKDKLLDTFGEGFNEARDGVSSGLDKMREQLADPELISAIREIGKTFAEWVPAVTGAAGTVIKTLVGLPGVIRAVKDEIKNNPDDPNGLIVQTLFGAGGPSSGAFTALMDNALRGTMDQLNQKMVEFRHNFTKSSQLPTDVQGPRLPSMTEYINGVAAGGKKWQEIDTTIEGIGTKTSKLGNDAIESAKKLKEIYDHTYDGLLKVGPEQETKLRATKDALLDFSHSWKESFVNDDGDMLGSFADKFKNIDPIKIADAAIKDFGGTLIESRKDVDNYAQSYGKLLKLGEFKPTKAGTPGAVGVDDAKAQLDFEKKKLELGAQATKENNEVAKKGQLEINQLTKDTWREIFNQYKRDVISPLGNVFDDLISTGGKNFGQVLAQGFLDSMHAKSQDLSQILVDAIAGGGITKTAQGTYVYKGVDYGKDPNAAKIAQLQSSPLAQATSTAVQAGGAFMNSYSAKGQTDLSVGASAVVGAAATVASLAAVYGSLATIPVYGWIAAAVIAVASYAGHLLQPSPSLHYQYGQVNTDPFGQAHFIGNSNVDKSTALQWQAQMQSTFDQFYGGFMKILLKFSEQILPKISKVFQPIVGRFEDGADLGFEASEKFAEELDRYFKVGLPHQIADKFSKYISTAFQSVGFSLDRFSQIWSRLSNMDPAKALTLLGTLADAAIGIDKYMKLFKTPVFKPAVDNLLARGNSSTEEGLFRKITDDLHKTFSETLTESDDDIIRLGESLKSLGLEDQINTMGQINTMMTTRYEKERAYLEGISKQIDQINSSFEAQMQGYHLAGLKKEDGTPDYQAQAAYLREQTNSLYSQLSSATTPEQVTSLYNQIAANIDKIYQAGSQLGPDAEKAYREWAEGNLTKARDAAIAAQNRLAAEVETANERFVNAIQGFIDAFEKATEKITPTVVTPPGGGGGDGPDDDKFKRLGSQVDLTTSAITTTGAVHTGLLTDIRSILASGRDIRVVIVDGGGGGEGNGGGQRGSFRANTVSSR